VTIGVRAVDKPPFISLTPGGANFTLPGAVDFYVMEGDTTLLAFTLGVDLIFFLTIVVKFCYSIFFAFFFFNFNGIQELGTF